MIKWYGNIWIDSADVTAEACDAMCNTEDLEYKQIRPIMFPKKRADGLKPRHEPHPIPMRVLKDEYMQAAAEAFLTGKKQSGELVPALDPDITCEDDETGKAVEFTALPEDTQRAIILAVCNHRFNGWV